MSHSSQYTLYPPFFTCVQGGALYIDGMQFALADTQGGLSTRGVLPKGTKRKWVYGIRVSGGYCSPSTMGSSNGDSSFAPRSQCRCCAAVTAVLLSSKAYKFQKMNLNKSVNRP